MRRGEIRRALLFVLLGAFLGCAGPPADPKSAPLTLVVIPKGTQHEFWKAVHAGAVKGGRELGVEMIWKGPIREDDREAQVAEVENFISRGVSGIVLAPVDEKALRVPVSNATRSGIPVVIIDSALESEDQVSFVATDNLRGGRLAGERMVQALAGKGKVILLRHMEGSASTMAREKGFLEVMSENPGMEVVSSNQFGGTTAETAYRASENLLARFKSGSGVGVEGIFCPNEGTAFGMLRALQDSGLAGKVIFVGFDSSEALVRGLEKGDIDSLVLQDPFNMGYLGVKTMVAHLRGEKVERRIDTGVNLATRENMNEPSIRELLRPELERWLN
jgi:ribose transport system substrate-binding protein